ncbi:putative deoxyribonuclease YcfH [Chitinispirillum alkaliphilum]|nr:putative deoxyribonuclease YcfH [Chitinispirillum alkaliphilum]
MWIDIHAHLFDLSPQELKNCIGEAQRSGICRVINNSVSLSTAETVIRQCHESQPLLKGAVGISPFDVKNQPAHWLSQLKKLAEDKHVIAVGEIGLDTSNPVYPPYDEQLPFFLQQLELAAELDLPALVHSRGAESQVAKICRETGAKKVIFHCFTGDRAALDYILESGYHISISGIVTYKNSHLSGIVPSIPTDRLFIETDTPYLSPVPKRGKPNTPANLMYTGNHISKLLNTEPDLLEQTIIDNYKKMFNEDPG